MGNVLLRGLVLGLTLLVLGSGPASAHASLVGSDPADGSSRATAPSTIVLTFNENIGDPAFVVVTAPDGTKVSTSKVKAVDRTVTATVADIDKKGRYSASYRVVSTDGHPVEGTFSYTVRSGQAVEQVSTPTTKSFVHRHTAHFFWGLLAAAAAIALLLAPLRRRDDKSNA
ncbi:copper resistance CopC family protein [Aeromicrobium sp.]|uniref:copper resistance CopC family protein n=1 Tax=Aeromicrobium sp. TaxID=1871063 RepID=UPI001992A492|nr:copper resistance CopC family protein [Aeromicrobium sp.]MBC7632342.1 copper resistance protein CopC [Aeromicrobium sp.]